MKTALENEETAEDLQVAGIRLLTVVTGEGLGGEGESSARSVFHSSRVNTYPNNLIPELRMVFDLIPSHKRQQAWEVIDDYYTPELSKKNQFDILDKLDIQDRQGGLDIAPWEVKPTQRSVNHLSRSPIDPENTGHIPDITVRSEGEQRWVHKVISTVEQLVRDEKAEGNDEAEEDITRIGVVKRRLMEQQKQQAKVVKVFREKPPQQQRPMQVKGKGAESTAIHARINQKMKEKYRRVSATLTRTFKRSVDLNTISKAVKGVHKGEWDFNNVTKKWEDRTDKRSVHFMTEVVRREILKEDEADSKGEGRRDQGGRDMGRGRVEG
jgi:hypothetical protein